MWGFVCVWGVDEYQFIIFSYVVIKFLVLRLHLIKNLDRGMEFGWKEDNNEYCSNILQFF